jgi:hypothetical protein
MVMLRRVLLTAVTVALLTTGQVSAAPSARNGTHSWEAPIHGDRQPRPPE